MTWSDGRSRRLLAAACGVACVVLPAACGADEGKAVFDAREPLPSCGDVTTRPDLDVEEPSAALAEAYACLDAAAAGEGAELVVRSLTVEGDPIVEYWRTGPGIDGLEIYTDGTQDTFGDQVWSHQTCPETETVTEPLGCQERAVVEG
ncbi:hypothetical protein [Isoptericola sp. NPDC060257]|uniref:hypothetical protein n=1 Tax=Isoptericola sp. NPDC060257 TaxID=3347087 RepID=UPI00365BA834